MKRLTKLTSLLAASALLLLFPDSNALTASAAANTFSFSYVEAEETWCYQQSGSFDEDEDFWTIEDLEEQNQDAPVIQNGDVVVIYGNKDNGGKIRISASLSNLTVLDTKAAVIVSTNGITDCFIGSNSVAAVNGNIKNAYVYDNAQVTFNNNITNLDINSPEDEDCLVTCAGTVGQLVLHDEADIYCQVYSIAAGELLVEDSELETSSKYYSKTPASAPASGSTSQSGNAGSSGSASSGEYDEVPKTGEAPLVFLLLAMAAICFAGSRALKETA